MHYVHRFPKGTFLHSRNKILLGHGILLQYTAALNLLISYFKFLYLYSWIEFSYFNQYWYYGNSDFIK